MWISSLVVTLADLPQPNWPGDSSLSGLDTQPGLDVQSSLEVPPAIRELRSIPNLTVGSPVGNRLPVVVEADRSESRYWHDWIGQLPGVIQVEVAFVSFEEVE